MKSTESMASKSASRLQARSKNAFFAKKNGEANGPEKTSTASALQTKSQSSPFFTSGGAAIQPKLEVHPSDDSYEKEADSVADKVMQHVYAAPPDPSKGSGGGNQV